MMKHPVPAYDTSYVCSPRLVFLLLMYPRSTFPPSLPVTKTFLSPCIARSSYMTTHHHHSLMTTISISLGPLVAIAGYCITWSPISTTDSLAYSVTSDCRAQVLTIRRYHACG